MEWTIKQEYDIEKIFFSLEELMASYVQQIDRNNLVIMSMINQGKMNILEWQYLNKDSSQMKELFQMAHLDYIIGDCPDKSLMN